MHVFDSKLRKAKRDYRCDACEYLSEAIDSMVVKFTFSEMRAIVKARQNNWKIKKGDIYEYQTVTDSGDFWHNKMIPEIHKINCKYNLYPDNF